MKATLQYLLLCALLGNAAGQATVVASASVNPAIQSSGNGNSMPLTAPPTAVVTPVPSSVLSVRFPPVGSIPRDFSPAGLQRLWDIVRL